MSDYGDYRRDVRDFSREARWTFFSVFFKVIVPIGILLVVIGWALHAGGIIGRDIEREVTQHSRQYVESKQAKLQTFYTEYVALNAEIAEFEAAGPDFAKVVNAKRAQQRALLEEMAAEADSIPDSQVPDRVYRLLAETAGRVR